MILLQKGETHTNTDADTLTNTWHEIVVAAIEIIVNLWFSHFFCCCQHTFISIENWFLFFGWIKEKTYLYDAQVDE